MNHFLGKRSSTLKSIDVKVDFNSNASTHFVSLENLKQCKNLEEVSMKFDGKHLTLLSELPKLKKLVLFNSWSVKDLISSFQLMDLSNLKYLSFRRIYDLSEFWPKFAKIHFPVIERLYFHITDPIAEQTFFLEMVKNMPKLKIIQFSGNIKKDLTDIFLLKIFKETKVFVFNSDPSRQLSMEEYFRSSSPVHYQMYHGMKFEFSKWFEF